MPRITDEPLQDKLVTFFKSDLDYLRSLYGQKNQVNLIIRTVVHSFVKQTQASANAEIDALETVPTPEFIE